MILNEYQDIDNIKNDNHILNESYFGKNKYLEKIDKLFDELLEITNINIRKLNKKLKYDIILTDIKKNNRAIEILNKISDLIKELFNFKEVFITLIPFGTTNGYTVTNFDSSEAIDDLDNRITNRKGVRYKKPVAALYVAISIETLSVSSMTGGCMTALLLHEIGHNFYKSAGILILDNNSKIFYKSIMLISTFIQKYYNLKYKIKFYKTKGYSDFKDHDILLKTLIPADILLELTQSKAILLKLVDIDKLNKFFGELKDKTKHLKTYEAIEAINTVLSNIFSISIANTIIYNNYKRIVDFFNFKIKKGVVKIFFSSPKIYMSDIIEKLFQFYISFFAFPNEQFADNFATSYGYGKETIMLQKILMTENLNLYDSIVNSNIITRCINDLTKIQSQLLVGMFDPHPGSISRMYDQILFLEENIKKEKDVAYKKKMLTDLKKIKEQYKEVEDILTNHELAKKGKIVSDLFNNLYFNTNGDLMYKVHSFINKSLYKSRVDGDWYTSSYDQRDKAKQNIGVQKKVL